MVKRAPIKVWFALLACIFHNIQSKSHKVEGMTVSNKAIYSFRNKDKICLVVAFLISWPKNPVVLSSNWL